MSRNKLLVTGAALLLVTACGERDGTEPVAADNAIQDSNAALAADDGMAMAASDFAASVAASDLYEIESGRLAAQKAGSAELKAFAEMLVTDHEKSTADLKTAVSQATPPISVAPALDSEKQAMLDALKAASAADFDRTFVDQQKQAHQKALDLLSQYQSSGDSHPLKDFASKASTVVQAHLDKLNNLQP